MSSFSYAGPSVAATFVAGIFNDAEERGNDKGDDASTEFGVARGATSDVAPSLAAALTTAPVIPETTIDVGELLSRQAELDAMGDNRGVVLSGLVDDIDDFLTEFFPGVDAGVATARAALVALLAGTNMADGKEVADLRLRQAEAKQVRTDDDEVDTLVAGFAARGFEAPPGELVYQIGARRRAQVEALADVSFDIDMAEGGRERENLERALRLLVDLRARAIAAFAAYLGAAVRERYEQAMAQSEAVFRAQETLAERIALQQQAMNRAAGLQIRAAQSDHGLTHGYLSTLDRLAERQAEAVLQKALALAKMLGAQAATAYNNFRASARIAGTEEINDL
jgi:hypothetical protein